MTSKLPTKLLKGPLVDAAFEIRFHGAVQLSTVLPGLLYSQLGGSSIERLPQADIPQQIRDNDPNLQYAPLVKLKVENFFISVGDRSLQVSCRAPYAGWALFMEQILKTLHTTNSINLVGPVIRYSLKYTDILPDNIMQNTSDYLSAQISIGGRGVDMAKVNLQAEILEGEAINLLQIAGRVEAQLIETGEQRSGLLVDIDSIRQTDDVSLDDFLGTAKENLISLHAVNKKLFFDCLSENGLTALEPSYE